MIFSINPPSFQVQLVLIYCSMLFTKIALIALFLDIIIFSYFLGHLAHLPFSYEFWNFSSLNNYILFLEFMIG